MTYNGIAHDSLYSAPVKRMEGYLEDTIDSAADVFTSWPTKSMQNKSQTYPFVVVKPPLISTESMTFKGSSKQANLSYQIYCYSNNAKSIDVIGDEVLSTLSDSTGINWFWDSTALQFENIESSDQRKLTIGKKKVYEKLITARYKWRG